MKLSAKIDYACRAVLELTLHYHDTIPVQLRTVAREQRIPKEFLVQIFSRLKEAGIVDSSRGMGGGYYLTRHPSSISLADVFGAMDSHILECTRPAKSSLDSEKLIFKIWAYANQRLAEALKGSFDDLAAQMRGFSLDYQI
jgi:Rrf2 family protein